MGGSDWFRHFNLSFCPFREENVKRIFFLGHRKVDSPPGGDFYSKFFAHFWHISEHLSRFHVLNPMYGTCYMTGFLQGIQWQHFCTHPNYANMHKCAYLPIFGRFLCITLILTIQMAYFMVDKGTRVHLQHIRVHISHFCYALCIKIMH